MTVVTYQRDALLHNNEYTYNLVPATEVFNRIARLQGALAKADLDGAAILDQINLFYYTGTMQSGVLFVPRAGKALFFVRRNLERARDESPIEGLLSFRRFDDLSAGLPKQGRGIRRLGLDEGTTPVSIFKKLRQVFPETDMIDTSGVLSMVRAVKSDYEIGLLREAGRRHTALFERIPAMLKLGMTEWELGSAIHACMLEADYTGIARFASFGGEMFAGVVSFGESGNYPSPFAGPDGFTGISPAFPLYCGRRRLAKGELVFVDTAFGYEGYYTDQTRVFSIGRPPQDALDAHQVCLDIQEALRTRLKPGAVPSQIYETVFLEEVAPRRFGENFMGFGANQVPFLGHGIGLVIDEFPAIAKKVNTPLEQNMAIALEPKKGLEKIGLVGIENTFIVTAQGGEFLTKSPQQVTIL